MLMARINNGNTIPCGRCWLDQSESLDIGNVLGLVEIMLVLPMHTAELERNFSLSKRIKTDWRNRLAPSTVSDLMTVKLSEINLDIHPTPFINTWLSSSECERRPYIKPHVKHAKKLATKR